MKDVQSRARAGRVGRHRAAVAVRPSLAFAYVAQFMYEYDAPVAERRAQALTLDRRMLAELVGADELRELIDPDALAALEAELQCLDEDRWATSIDGAHDLLRRLGDLTHLELRARATDDFARPLITARRAVEVRVAGEARLIAIEDAGRYRDGVGAVVPHGVPDAFLEPVPDAPTQLIRRWARTHGPFLAAEPAARFGFPVERVELVLEELSRDGTLLLRRVPSEAASSASGATPRCCAGCGSGRWPRCARRSSPPTPRRSARFLPRWHGVDTDARGLDRAYEVVSQLQGVALPASVLERDVLVDPRPRLLAPTARRPARRRRGHVGRRRLAGPRRRQGAAVPAGRSPLLLPRSAGVRRQARRRPSTTGCAMLLGTRGACFFRDLAGSSEERATLDALWDLVWAGEVTNDSFAAVRALSAKKRSGGAARGGRPRLSSLTALGPPHCPGALVAGRRRHRRPHRSRATPWPACCSTATACSPAESARAEGVPGGFAAVYPVLRAMEEAGRIRRGYFVAGLGGAQFALPGAVDRLRAVREPARRAAARPRRHRSRQPVRHLGRVAEPAGRKSAAGSAGRRRVRRARRRRGVAVRREGRAGARGVARVRRLRGRPTRSPP